MCGLAAALLLPGTATVQADLHYVDLNGTNASPPYTNWITAATNIQDAVDSAVPGDEIVVTNGTYATGGRSGNHMVVDNPLSVRSVNGPLFTTIDGGHSVRCAYLTNGASLCGFTLANGFASARANQYPETAYGYAVGFLAARSRTAS